MAIGSIKYPTLLNGVSYSWGSTQIFMLNKNVIGCRSFNYKVTSDTENIYGTGINPVQRGFGNLTYEGSLTLLKEEAASLQTMAPLGNIIDIPAFDITVTYMPSPTKICTDILKKCVFTSNGSSSSQGDKSIEVELTLSIGSIEFGQPL